MNGVENINIYNDEVSVECDNTCMGCPDTHYFSFPVFFLSMTDEELEKAVVVEKERREEEERMEALRKLQDELRKKEEQERLQYERLKKKFENQ
ncbi:MAG: hypothetical protein ACOC22_01455 [bacterium]